MQKLKRMAVPLILAMLCGAIAGCGRDEHATGGLPGSPAASGSTAGGGTGTEMTGQAGGEPAAAATVDERAGTVPETAEALVESQTTATPSAATVD
jgi:hypothetical protein